MKTIPLVINLFSFFCLFTPYIPVNTTQAFMIIIYYFFINHLFFWMFKITLLLELYVSYYTSFTKHLFIHLICHLST